MIRRLFVRDIGLKLLALALAVAFWMQVAGQPVVERGIDVPLAFENVPELLYVGSDMPDSVRVRVRGAANIVSGLQPGDVVAAIDLAGEPPGPPPPVRHVRGARAGPVRRRGDAGLSGDDHGVAGTRRRAQGGDGGARRRRAGRRTGSRSAGSAPRRRPCR